MQWSTSKCGNYRVETLSSANFNGALEVIREAFCQDEAVCIGSEVNQNPEAVTELLELCADTALDGVSLVCVCAATGQVVAVSFNKIQVSSSESSEESFFEKFTRERCKQPSAQSLIRFMSTVDARCNLFEKYKTDCSLELMFLATLKEHRRKGLGALLTQDSLTLATNLQDGSVATMTVQDLGQKYASMPPRCVETKKCPKICQAIFTSSTSQKLGHKLGFTVDAVISYEEFSYNGKTYAERIGLESPVTELVSKMIPLIADKISN